MHEAIAFPRGPRKLSIEAVQGLIPLVAALIACDQEIIHMRTYEARRLLDTVGIHGVENPQAGVCFALHKAQLEQCITHAFEPTCRSMDKSITCLEDLNCFSFFQAQLQS